MKEGAPSMSVNYRLSPHAEIDLWDAYDWYESKKSGLGEAFFSALRNAKMAISANPATYKVIFKKRVRVYAVHNFPYQILYILEKDNVNVISIFNTYRSPSVWKNRVS